MTRLPASSAATSAADTLTARRYNASAAPPAPGPNDVNIYDNQGEKVTVTPLKQFSMFVDKLQPWIKKGIEALGFANPTTIQAYTFPLLFDGKDVIGLAATGSGKTVGFGVPALNSLSPRTGYPQVIVLCPVRELAQHTAVVMRQLCQFNSELAVGEAYGGASRSQQQNQIYNGCDILVATPGRLKDFLDSGVVDCKDVKYVVFDEADRLLDMGFSRPIQEIMRYMPAKRQTMMWSATWPPEVQQLADSYLSRNRYMIKVGQAGEGLIVNPNIKHVVSCHQTDRDRLVFLAQLYEKKELDPNVKTILFVQRKDTCDIIASRIGRGLESAGIMKAKQVVPIHGGMDQRTRDGIVRNFKGGQIMILVATDVAARGLDFPDVGFVVNYDCPKDIESYCHRVGRTGRAGRKGTAFSFIMPDAKAITPDLVDYLGKCKMAVPSELREIADDAREWLRRRAQKKEKFGRNRGGDDGGYQGYEWGGGGGGGGNSQGGW